MERLLDGFVVVLATSVAGLYLLAVSSLVIGA